VRFQLRLIPGPETLFRGHTPLSKLLAASMRLLCPGFLFAAIAPTVSRLASPIAALSDEDVFEIADACLADIIGQSFANN